jgi:hypothetical protein
MATPNLEQHKLFDNLCSKIVPMVSGVARTLSDFLATSPRLVRVAVEWADNHQVWEDDFNMAVDCEVKCICHRRRKNLPSIRIGHLNLSGRTAWGRREDEYRI